MSMTDATSAADQKQRTQSPESDPAPEAPAVPKRAQRKTGRLIPLVVVACIMALGAAGAWYWRQQEMRALPDGITKANGRLEAEQVEIATKFAGRIAVVLAREGQMVDAGEVIARMDTTELEAQLQAAEAQVRRAEYEKTQAEAIIVQRDSERTYARQELQRTSTLIEKGFATGQKLDQMRNQMRTAQASYETAVASLDAAKATILAEKAGVARLKSQIDDSTLIAPRRGRIQYKLAQPGEVLAAGGRVLTLLDLTDVYMTVFLPAREAGQLTIGDDARIILDPVPQYVIPARVTFIATEAQFTPKTVETAEEREKLMFRVKLSIASDLLKQYENQVKTGLRGVAFVRTKLDADWPENLAVKLP